jgi:hypothetical protein
VIGGGGSGVRGPEGGLAGMEPVPGRTGREARPGPPRCVGGPCPGPSNRGRFAGG